MRRIALHPEHGDEVNLLLQRADIAMYSAKARGSGSDIGAVPPAVVGHSVGVAPAASGVIVKPKGMATFLPLQEEDRQLAPLVAGQKPLGA